MRNLLFILLMFLTACNLSEQVEVAPEIVTAEVQSASPRANIVISAAITNYQLDGQGDDFAFIEFTIEPGQTPPEEITFDFNITSSFDFEGIFSVFNAYWSIEELEQTGSTNSFNCTIIYNDPYPTGFVIEDIICQLPSNGGSSSGCGDCQGPPTDCIIFGF